MNLKESRDLLTLMEWKKQKSLHLSDLFTATDSVISRHLISVSLFPAAFSQKKKPTKNLASHTDESTCSASLQNISTEPRDWRHISFKIHCMYQGSDGTMSIFLVFQRRANMPRKVYFGSLPLLICVGRVHAR
jgi:hypothetical protein